MNNFAGKKVLALESRRAAEMAKLIATYGGEAMVAPSMREVPLASNREALAFAAALRKGEYDMVIFLTGVGARALLAVVETAYPREEYVAALRGVTVVARGPKPIAALREIGVTAAITAPEPNTWRELLYALDNSTNATATNAAGYSLQNKKIAVQEYGTSNPELLAGLAERGANVMRVPVYQWALPEDVGPLRAAVRALVDGKIDVVLFTTAVQIIHLFQIAAEMKQEEAMRNGLRRTVIASIGPTTSEELARHDLVADMEPTHPKMGFLVKEAAEQTAELLGRKRETS